ncbi:MAG: substrate-binding domain-containing protein [Planctomycetes bacterium]|nr:substrate-binding domain-containing protein [Planctomycetota bacterium]
MLSRSCFAILGIIGAAVTLAGCNRGGGTSADLDLGNGYKLIATKTDEGSATKCQTHAEDLLLKRPKVACLVGLWEYNPPALLRAVRGSGKKVAIVAFDENKQTLEGIKDGSIEGTVVQDPEQFGFQSIKILAILLTKGNDDFLKSIPNITKNNSIFVEHKVVTKDGVDKFKADVDKILNQKIDPGDQTGKPKVAFVSNNAFEFWTFAEKGAQRAAKEFGVQLIFRKPQDSSPATQRNIIQDLISSGVKGIAVSPNEPKNAQDFFKTEVAPKIKLVMVDNDLPDSSARLCYIGTHNYRAGRSAGDLVKKAIPNGGEVAIFVGQMGATNAIERRQGVLDVLAGKDQTDMGEVTPAR